MKKILKGLAWIIAIPVVLFLLAATLLYIPSIQNFIVGQVTTMVSDATGMRIRVDNVRLGFPLDLWVNGVNVQTAEGDTLLTAEAIRVDIQVWPLVRKQVEVDGISLRRVSVNTMDLIPSVELKGALGEFYLSSHGVALDPEIAVVNKLLLRDTDLSIRLHETAEPDTAASEPVYWKILLRELTGENTQVTVHTSDTTSLVVGWEKLQALAGEIDLHAGAYKLQHLALGGGLFAMNNDTLPARPGLDAAHLYVDRWQMTLDSLAYAGERISAVITEFAARERSGLSVSSLQGKLYADEQAIYIPAIRLETTDSYLETAATIDWKALGAGAGGAVKARLLARLGKQDLMLLAGGMPENFVRAYPNHPLVVRAGVGGNLEHLQLTALQADLQGAFAFRANGEMRHLTDSVQRQGLLDWNLETHDMRFVTALSDSLSSMLAIPPVTLDGFARVAGSRYTAGLTAQEGKGLLELAAEYDAVSDAYRADLSVDSLNVRDFLPHDSIGYVSTSLALKGRGFDFYSPRTELTADLAVNRLQYDVYDLSGVSLAARVEQGKGMITLDSDNEWLQMHTTLATELIRRTLSARLSIQVDKADLQGLHVTAFPLETQAEFGMIVNTNLKDAHRIEGALENLRFKASNEKTFKTKDLFFEVGLTPDSTCMEVKAGDLKVHLDGKQDVTHIIGAFSAFAKELAVQTENKWLDQNKLKSLLPELCLRIQSGPDNPICNYLNVNGLRYSRLDVDMDTSPVNGMNGYSHIYSLRTDSLQIDTIRLNIRQDSLGVKSRVEVRNAPANKQVVFDARLDAFIHPKGAAFEVNYYDGKGEQGVHLGFNAALADEGINLKFFPEHPTIAFQQFTLNKDNYVLFRNNGRIDADLALENAHKTAFRFYSSEGAGAKQDLTVDLQRLNLGELMTVLPYLPDITGIWDAEFHYMETDEGPSFVVETSVDSLTYEKLPLGDVACAALYLPKEGNVHFMDVRVSHNEHEVMGLTGDYHNVGEGSLDMTMELNRFPLSLANGFIPDQMVTLAGVLDGNLSVQGEVSAPKVNGQLALNTVTLASAAYGAHFRLDDRPVKIKDSRMLFDEFSVYTRKKEPFTMTGNIDFSDFSQIGLDLRMVARDFELINAPRTKNSVVYGKVYVDLFSTLKGTLDQLKMRGNLNVQGKTDVTYVLKDSPLTVEDRLSGLVTFVNFNDTVQVPDEMQVPTNTGSIDMSMVMQISEGAHVRVDLSEDRESYISLYGGGNLSMQYTPQGELRLSGRYTVVSGDMKYALPVIPLKTFSLKSGSYVEFTGDPMNPRMNIVATERMRSTVTENDTPRSVNFEVGIAITNSLENMGLEFRLEAPEDLSLQNKLASMSKEERGKLAVAMLATGIYLGEGGGSGNSNGGFDANDALNSFLQSEITSIAGGALKTVDISLGMEDVTGSDGTQHKDYSFRFAKRFWNNRLSVVVGGRISTEEDTENAGNSETFIDDISLEWRLDDSGTRYVRVFHNTNFDSMLDGEITETGAGIVLRRRMTKLGELFIFRKKKPAEAPRRKQETTTQEK